MLIPLIIGFSQPISRKNLHLFSWISFFCLLLFFMGFRYQVGADWTGYEYMYDEYSERNINDIFFIAEPGFFLLNKFCDFVGLNHQGVVFISALFFLAGCFSYAKITSNPWLAITVVMPYLIFIISMSGIRQATAIGIGYLMLGRWSVSSNLEKFLLVSLAVSFHNTAIVFLLFVLFSLKQSISVRLLLGFLVLLVVGYGLNINDSIDRYQKIYVEENIVSDGAFFHVLLTAIPSFIYLYYRKKLLTLNLFDKNVALASFLTIGLMPLLQVSSTGVDRLILYFSFVQMWVYPTILQAGFVNRNLIRVAIGLLTITILLIYLFYGTHADAYIPYKNFLLGLE